MCCVVYVINRERARYVRADARADQQTNAHDVWSLNQAKRKYSFSRSGTHLK